MRVSTPFQAGDNLDHGDDGDDEEEEEEEEEEDDAVRESTLDDEDEDEGNASWDPTRGTVVVTNEVCLPHVYLLLLRHPSSCSPSSSFSNNDDNNTGENGENDDNDIDNDDDDYDQPRPTLQELREGAFRIHQKRDWVLPEVRRRGNAEHIEWIE
jgi:hypothetical protein